MSSKRSKEEVKQLFKKFDNGNGHLSLAEVDKAMLSYNPQLASNKKVIMQAFKAADAGGNGFIELKEFEKMLGFLDYYGELHEMFQELDTNGDKRISFNEFKRGFELTGDNEADDNYLKQEFNKIDTNKGGYIMFDEFCSYMANRKAD